MLPVILYLAFSFLVGLLGIGKRGGFLLHLVAALVLTPVGGLIIALVTPDVVKQRKNDVAAGK
ncbi:MAG: hypothetical protein RLZZ08_1420 [Pseudomonadota bacterium]|jgi:hypothetical protein